MLIRITLPQHPINPHHNTRAQDDAEQKEERDLACRRDYLSEGRVARHQPLLDPSLLDHANRSSIAREDGPTS